MLEILYEDKDVIVVLKPAGIPSQADRSGDKDIYSLIREHLGKDINTDISLGLVQRLDRPVGGIMVLSKSPLAAKRLTAMVAEGDVEKYYLAMVDGRAEEEATLEHWIQQVRGNRSVISNKRVSAGKKAVLTYKCLGRYRIEGRDTSLLRIRLYTGRHHQIRAQLAHMKLPLVGDTKYNPRYQGVKGWHHIGLFAYELTFRHPVTNQIMSFQRIPDQEPFVIAKETLINP